MVAVAADHALELAQLLRAHAHEAVLVEHEQTEAIAGVEEFGRRRVVRGTVAVHSNLLEAGDAESLQRVGQRHAHAGVVLVIIGAMDLHVPAVEEETTIGVEKNAADAEGRLVTVPDGAADADRRDKPMQHGRLQRPEARVRDVKRAGIFPRGARGERQ